MTRLQTRTINALIALATLAMLYACAQVPMNPTDRVDLVHMKVRF